MPSKGGGSGGSVGDEVGSTPLRRSSRPPWVKDEPPSLPAPPSAPWLRQRDPQPLNQQKEPRPMLKKTVKVIQSQKSKENGKSDIKGDGGKEEGGKREEEEDVGRKGKKVVDSGGGSSQEGGKETPPGKESSTSQHRKGFGKEGESRGRKTPTLLKASSVSKEPQPPPPPTKKPPQPPSIKETPKEASKETKKVETPTPEVKTQKTMEPPPPPPPPPPPMAPPLPKPPVNEKPMTVEKAAKLEALRSRPRRRPDWTDMMKEVEKGAQLRHVQCNDRSAPVLPKAKAKGQFVYESEKDNVHNQLLKQIQQGVHLKRVKTNDRSKPLLQGLRKFRRQMTIEEQIQKSASVADVVAVASEPDELDDIDKVRDDLQSTKQMLALELRNKEALERENKRLMARLLNLEVELEKEKMSKQIEKDKGSPQLTRTVEDNKLIGQLKDEAKQSGKMAKDMEDMYHKTAEELDVTRAKLESAWLQNSQLEMALKSMEKRGDAMENLVKQPSRKLVPSMSNAKPLNSSTEEETEEEETETETETEEEGGAESAAQQEKRIQRELKLLTSRVRNLKDKRMLALKEKGNLRELFSKLHKQVKEEKKKYKELQKEVDKMAKLMKDVDGEEEENDNEEEDDDEDTETGSESDESDEERESEGDLPESSSNDDKIQNLKRRIKVHENRLTTLKKSNYLLKANIDRRQDDLSRQKEMSLTLQEDLNSVLEELG